MDRRMVQASKWLSLILRHEDELIDEEGWALVTKVLEKMKMPFSYLKEIVETDQKESKGRYSFNADFSKIRAVQGHSVKKVEIKFSPITPPEFLYHGTSKRFESEILKQGLLPMKRKYVHISKDLNTAITVGSRHGQPIVFTVKALEMHNAGHEWFLSENGVYLIKHVPVEYLINNGG